MRYLFASVLAALALSTVLAEVQRYEDPTWTPADPRELLPRRDWRGAREVKRVRVFWTLDADPIPGPCTRSQHDGCVVECYTRKDPHEVLADVTCNIVNPYSDRAVCTCHVLELAPDDTAGSDPEPNPVAGERARTPTTGEGFPTR